MMCEKCGKMNGLLLLIFGVLFLLGDLGVWGFWGVSWYTVLFFLGAGVFMAKHGCPMCKSCGTDSGKKRK
jgi:hypothetical protein